MAGGYFPFVSVCQSENVLGGCGWAGGEDRESAESIGLRRYFGPWMSRTKIKILTKIIGVWFLWTKLLGVVDINAFPFKYQVLSFKV